MQFIQACLYKRVLIGEYKHFLSGTATLNYYLKYCLKYFRVNGELWKLYLNRGWLRRCRDWTGYTQLLVAGNQRQRLQSNRYSKHL